MNHSPLLRKALAALVLVFGVTLIATSLLTLWRTQSNLTAEYTSKGTAIAESIAGSSVETLLFRDVSTIQSTIDQSLEIEGVAYIVVVDPQGQVLAHTFVPTVPEEVRKLESGTLNTIIQEVQINGRGKFLNVSTPILAGKVGHVHVGMDQGRIQSAIWRAVRNQVLMLLLIFSTSLVAAYFLMNRIVGPLRRLTTYANRLAAGARHPPTEAPKGDSGITPITARSDEVGQLAKAFQDMVLELSAREEQLRKAHAELESRVRERTSELEQTNTRLTQEVAIRQETEEDLRETAEDLARSNAELQQFAYVASHDLQEPLRIVISYLDLLVERYRDKLDAKADRWINFTVEAATRMKQLINDLLEFSRVTRREKPFVPSECAQVFDMAMANLRQVIKETGARVSRGALPVVLGDATQLTQVLQNLIGNAIKYHGTSPPEIHVEAVRQGGVWQFAVRDNGIGIDPQFHERIFVIFQRLHTRTEYPGTGIGLALCKRIVERHGGRIWVESQPGQGATFFFTIPAQHEQASVEG
jgi:signal transduction histidine kinase